MQGTRSIQNYLASRKSFALILYELEDQLEHSNSKQ